MYLRSKNLRTWFETIGSSRASKKPVGEVKTAESDKEQAIKQEAKKLSKAVKRKSFMTKQQEEDKLVTHLKNIKDKMRNYSLYTRDVDIQDELRSLQ